MCLQKVTYEWSEGFLQYTSSKRPALFCMASSGHTNVDVALGQGHHGSEFCS